MSRNQYFEEEVMFSRMGKEALEEYRNASPSRQQRMRDQAMLSYQDDRMWAQNMGVSQLEGRIETDSFQG